MQLSVNDSLAISRRVIEEVKKVIIGKDEVIIKVFMTILSGGHVLLDDIPGVGKTTLALAFSRALSLDYKRLQFTPDVLPSDVTGFSVFNKETGKFEFKAGAAMCNLFLADEINRTSPKTQSALLELMEEKKITVDGVTRALPSPYFVIATQNPIGSVGTQNLPESQMDRFTVCLSMGYPDIKSEVQILKGRQNANVLENVAPAANIPNLIALQETVAGIYADDRIYEYVAALCAATRNHPLIRLGVSPRGSLAVMKMAKASALLRGRDYVLPEDVKYVFCDVSAHRIILNSRARTDGSSKSAVLKSLIDQTAAPTVGKN